jgi:hypothetical protein
MSSESPMSEIAANIALERGYNPCDKFSGNENFFVNNLGCKPGFIPAPGNEYCYKVLPTLETFNDGKSKCEHEYDAEMIMFLCNNDVLAFISLLKTGTYYKYSFFT